MPPPVRPLLAPGLLFLFSIAPAVCADLSMSAQGANPGGSILIPISLASGGESISGIQFDLLADNPALSLVPVIGDAVRNSGKTIYVASPGDGSTRILITELNQDSIADGILVNLFVNVAPTVVPGSYSIHFKSAVATDAYGDPVALSTQDSSITVAPGYAAAIKPEGVLNGATLLPGPIAPGEIITIIGAIGASPSSPSLAVSFDGFTAPQLYASSSQINAVVPFELDGASSTTLEVAGPAGRLQVSLPVASSAPGIFALGGSGTGQGAILNQDGSINSPANPAPAGSIATLFATGAGQTNPPGHDGIVATGILPQPRLPVSVKIGGSLADILYSGAAPGLISGALQVNCRIPSKTASGSVPVVLYVGEEASPPVMLAVK